MSKHTKGLWKLDQYGNVVQTCNGQVCVTGFALSCGPRNKEAEANARHIVHCVNNHERLVELLDKALGCMLVGIDHFSVEDREVYEDGCTLLATLVAEKGGES